MPTNIEFASFLTDAKPSMDAVVSPSASCSARSRDLRTGPLMATRRCLPPCMLLPWGKLITACQTMSLPGPPGFSRTSAWQTPPFGSAVVVLCGILVFSVKPSECERDLGGGLGDSLGDNLGDVRGDGARCKRLLRRTAGAFAAEAGRWSGEAPERERRRETVRLLESERGAAPSQATSRCLSVWECR
mmetsp:Transcript_22333/g.45067  ORF Transcript_22333/g.45067 Transcript_22333/m.45067 type:complete len:188 (-) Transcript_22333:405-968(-)